MAARLASGKKSDSIVYKDGFLGVRGWTPFLFYLLLLLLLFICCKQQ
jgi:hypothetical protein